MNIKLDFKDILIVPSEISNIDSRQDVFPYYQYNEGIHLPLIAAPMDTVVGAENAQYFIDNKINVCYPRGEVFLKYPEVNHPVMQFESISLQEFDEIVLRWNNIATFKNSGGKYYVCIDVANGHMGKLHKLIRRAKNQYKDNIVIMAGNIALHAVIRLKIALFV